MEMEMKCIKCGAKQEKDKEQSNKNWASYNCKAKCKCGGKFGMYLDGELVGGGPKKWSR